MAYSNTGEGLHRFVDPADGQTYLYAHMFLDGARRIFPCFDQPDLKAPFTRPGHRAAGLAGRRQRRAGRRRRGTAGGSSRRPCRWRPTS